MRRYSWDGQRSSFGFSSAATKGSWTVNAFDYDYYFRGASPNLTLSLDKSEGRNGDTLHLTITPKSADREPRG
jgi:hypothetical protein